MRFDGSVAAGSRSSGELARHLTSACRCRQRTRSRPRSLGCANANDGGLQVGWVDTLLLRFAAADHVSFEFGNQHIWRERVARSPGENFSVGRRNVSLSGTLRSGLFRRMNFARQTRRRHGLRMWSLLSVTFLASSSLILASSKALFALRSLSFRASSPSCFWASAFSKF